MNPIWLVVALGLGYILYLNLAYPWPDDDSYGKWRDDA